MSEKKLTPEIITQTMKEIEEGILIPELRIKSICEEVSKLFKKQENIRKIEAPVTVCGDIHGQFEDLQELFIIGGSLPETSYLFLGDYVDRGSKSIETIIYLFCLKIKYPERITMIRGNHESRITSKAYGFYKECLFKYHNCDNVWKFVTDTFDFMPIGALIGDEIFAVHGGLSPKVEYIEDVSFNF